MMYFCRKPFYMKKVIFSLVLFILPIFAFAQNAVKSYNFTGGYCPQTGTYDYSMPNYSYIEYYDNYLMFNGSDRYNYAGQNPDGSHRFVATKPGAAILRNVGILVSNDMNSVRLISQSSFNGMTLEMWFNYQFVADGKEYALNASSAIAPIYNGSSSSDRGSSSYGSSDNDYIETIEYAPDYTGNAPDVWCSKCGKYMPRHSHIKKRIR